MNIAIKVFHELAGLFVDDGALALAILGVVLLASLFAALMPGAPIAAGIVLLLGCVGVLFVNVMNAARR